VSSSHSASCPCVHKCVSLRFSRFRLAAQGTRHASVAADVYSPHVCWSHPLSCSVGIRGRRADRKGAPSRPQPRRAPSAGRAAPAGGGGGHWQRCPVTAVPRHSPRTVSTCRLPACRLQQQLPAAAPRPGCKAQPCHWGRRHGTHPAAVAAMVALAAVLAARHALRNVPTASSSFGLNADIRFSRSCAFSAVRNCSMLHWITKLPIATFAS